MVHFRDVTERVRAEEEARRREENLLRRAARRAAQLSELIEELKENEARLRESEERVQVSFEESDLALLSPDGRFEKANPKLRELLDRENLSDVGLQEVLLHPDDLEEDLGLLRQAHGSDGPATAGVRLLGGNGREVWVSLKARPALDVRERSRAPLPGGPGHRPAQEGGDGPAFLDPAREGGPEAPG